MIVKIYRGGLKYAFLSHLPYLRIREHFEYCLCIIYSLILRFVRSLKYISLCKPDRNTRDWLSSFLALLNLSGSLSLLPSPLAYYEFTFMSCSLSETCLFIANLATSHLFMCFLDRGRVGKKDFLCVLLICREKKAERKASHGGISYLLTANLMIVVKKTKATESWRYVTVHKYIRPL